MQRKEAVQDRSGGRGLQPAAVDDDRSNVCCRTGSQVKDSSLLAALFNCLSDHIHGVIFVTGGHL